jgi:hypothetical protein
MPDSAAAIQAWERRLLEQRLGLERNLAKAKSALELERRRVRDLAHELEIAKRRIAELESKP